MVPATGENENAYPVRQAMKASSGPTGAGDSGTSFEDVGASEADRHLGVLTEAHDVALEVVSLAAAPTGDLNGWGPIRMNTHVDLPTPTLLPERTGVTRP